MDIMYYTSPIYCAEIQRGLVTELNRLYSMFVERNPSRDVKVSIVAHSLGCVIVYDIITGWLPMVWLHIHYELHLLKSIVMYKTKMSCSREQYNFFLT